MPPPYGGAGIIIELIERKCSIPVLLDSLECYSLTIADVKSLDFTVTRTFPGESVLIIEYGHDE